MAHFAKLDENNIVQEIIVVHNNELLDEDGNEIENNGINFLENIFGHRNWKQTSYNKTFRKNYAGIGYTYDSDRDAFIPPKPYESWVLNETSCNWDPPVPMPTDGNLYIWNETTISWKIVAVRLTTLSALDAFGMKT